MDSSRIQQFQRAQPFRPFRIVLGDGRCFEVRNPRHMLVTSLLLFVGTEIDADDVPARTVMTQPCHVVQIDLLPDADSA